MHSALGWRKPPNNKINYFLTEKYPEGPIQVWSGNPWCWGTRLLRSYCSFIIQGRKSHCSISKGHSFVQVSGAPVRIPGRKKEEIKDMPSLFLSPENCMCHFCSTHRPEHSHIANQLAKESRKCWFLFSPLQIFMLVLSYFLHLDVL